MNEDMNPSLSVDQARLDANWRAINIELDAPQPVRIERMLRRVGMPTHITRLVVATPALRTKCSWRHRFEVYVSLPSGQASCWACRR